MGQQPKQPSPTPPRTSSSSSNANDLDPDIGLGEILDSLHFIFVAHGVLLLAVVVVGVALNSLCLGVLCRRTFRSSPPHCLLQALTLGDLAVLLLSLYSDVQPAIAAHRALQTLALPDEATLRRLEAMLLRDDPHGDGRHRPGFTRQNGTALAFNQSAADPDPNPDRDLELELELELFLKSLLGPDAEFELRKLPEGPVGINGSEEQRTRTAPRVVPRGGGVVVGVGVGVGVGESSPGGDNGTRDGGGETEATTTTTTTTTVEEPRLSPATRATATTPPRNDSSGIEINTEPIRKATERFAGYFLMTYSPLVVLTLALERLFVVLRPLRAKAAVTAGRTRRAILVITVACFLVHCPQLVREVVLVCTEPARVRDDFRGTLLQSFRRGYETFLMYLTSSLLAAVLAANVGLIVAVTRQRSKVRRRLREETQTTSAEKKRNINVAYVVIFLSFCQLPQSIAGNVVTHLAMTTFKRHVTVFIKTAVVVRVLYVTNSALNCLVYCLFAQRFRQVFVDTYFRFCRTRATTESRTNGCGSSPEISGRSRLTTQPSPTVSAI